MPIYEFRCPKCEHEFEKVVSYSKIDEVECPECEEKPVERLMSLFAAGPANNLSTSFSPSSSGGSCGREALAEYKQRGRLPHQNKKVIVRFLLEKNYDKLYMDWSTCCCSSDLDY